MACGPDDVGAVPTATLPLASPSSVDWRTILKSRRTQPIHLEASMKTQRPLCSFVATDTPIQTRRSL